MYLLVCLNTNILIDPGVKSPKFYELKSIINQIRYNCFIHFIFAFEDIIDLIHVDHSIALRPTLTKKNM